MLRNLEEFLRRRLRDISRFRYAQRATTMVEFALVAPIFLALLVAILETTLFLFAQAALQDAAVEAGRLFMTGQAQNNGWLASNIQTQVCSKIQALMTCSNVTVVVQNYASFASANTACAQLYSGGQPVTSFAYDPGTPGDVMVVQLLYEWPVLGGPLGFALPTLPNGTAEICGTSAFRVEPYSG